MLIQHNKRPFADDDTLQLPYKQSRQSSYDSPFCVEFINGYGPEKSLNSDADHGSQLSAFQTIPLTSRSSGRPTTSGIHFTLAIIIHSKSLVESFKMITIYIIII